MDKRGVEVAGPILSIQTIMFTVLSVATVILLFYIFMHLVK
jgi:hypothetical protein